MAFSGKNNPGDKKVTAMLKGDDKVKQVFLVAQV